MREIGASVSSWRKLRRLTQAEVADRAGIAITTVLRLEKGEGSTVENLLKIARSLGVLDQLVSSLDPYSTDLGRLRADEQLPGRVRHPAS